MRIVFLHHANVCKGGIERVQGLKANLLAETPATEVIMLTYEQNGVEYPYPLSSKVKCIDLNVRLYKAYKYKGLQRVMEKRRLKRLLYVALKEKLAELNADIVVCTDKSADELNILLKAKSKEKIIVEAHTGLIDHDEMIRRVSSYKKLVTIIERYRLRKVIQRSDMLVALTPEDVKQWGKRTGACVIPNFLPFYPETVKDDQTRKRVIVVGRIDYQKGQDRLLTAWKKVEKKHPDWHLDIYGDGNEGPKAGLSALKESLQLETVTIHPATSSIYAEYMQSDFLVCSSRYESFGVIIIEAMSCGIPVVSFDCDNGPRNIISNGEDGLLVRNGDVEELASKICLMIENDAMRKGMGIIARKNVERFKVEKVFPQYLELYQSLCK